MSSDQRMLKAASVSTASRALACTLGVVSLAGFFVPLVAPFVQALTLVYVLVAAWRGSLDRISVIIGATGAALGFILFLATEFIWIV